MNDEEVEKMAYCTLSDLQKKMSAVDIIQLTDDEQTGSIVESIVNSAIEEADTLINIYLRQRYSMPLSPVPDIITKLSVSLTRYNLYSRRPPLAEDMLSEYKNVIKILEQIRDNKVSIGAESIDADEKPSASSKFHCNKTSDSRMFPQSELDKF
ncbi:MAG: DUF1320 domain-containing protein [Pseudomonadota bacterium]